MTIQFNCPKCGYVLKCREEFRGRQFACPKCTSQVQAPVAIANPTEIQPVPDSTGVENDAWTEQNRDFLEADFGADVDVSSAPVPRSIQKNNPNMRPSGPESGGRKKSQKMYHDPEQLGSEVFVAEKFANSHLFQKTALAYVVGPAFLYLIVGGVVSATGSAVLRGIAGEQETVAMLLLILFNLVFWGLSILFFAARIYFYIDAMKSAKLAIRERGIELNYMSFFSFKKSLYLIPFENLSGIEGGDKAGMMNSGFMSFMMIVKPFTSRMAMSGARKNNMVIGRTLGGQLVVYHIVNVFTRQGLYGFLCHLKKLPQKVPVSYRPE